MPLKSPSVVKRPDQVREDLASFLIGEQWALAEKTIELLEKEQMVGNGAGLLADLGFDEQTLQASEVHREVLPLLSSDAGPLCLVHFDDGDIPGVKTAQIGCRNGYVNYWNHAVRGLGKRGQLPLSFFEARSNIEDASYQISSGLITKQYCDDCIKTQDWLKHAGFSWVTLYDIEALLDGEINRATQIIAGMTEAFGPLDVRYFLEEDGVFKEVNVTTINLDKDVVPHPETGELISKAGEVVQVHYRNRWAFENAPQAAFFEDKERVTIDA